ncbi:hypothetical protein INR49_018349, partial [Caranx melampygus]
MADLKCDGKTHRGTAGSQWQQPEEEEPGPHGESDPDIEDDFTKPYTKGLSSNPAPYSYLSLTDSSHSLPGEPPLNSLLSPHQRKKLVKRTMDFDENDDSLFSSHPSSLPPPSSLDPLPDNALLRIKPVYTYSRNNSQNHNHVQNHSYSRPSPINSNVTGSIIPGAPPASSSMPVAASDSTSQTALSSSAPPPPATSAAVSSSSSSSVLPSNQPPPQAQTPLTPCQLELPPQVPGQRVQMASQSLQQQRASRMLLTSVSQSLEMLAQSVQLLVESQHEFVQESLLLQRETVDILRDFSNTALTMLRDKSN